MITVLVESSMSELGLLILISFYQHTQHESLSFQLVLLDHIPLLYLYMKQKTSTNTTPVLLKAGLFWCEVSSSQP